MTDTNNRALLDAAARAAGIEGEYECWAGMGFKEGIRQVLNGSKCQRPWNPLTDDGDALRLAVQCGLEVSLVDDDHPDGRDTRACAGYPKSETRPCKIAYVFEDHKSDIFAATRRAITRAAAAMDAQGGVA